MINRSCGALFLAETILHKMPLALKSTLSCSVIKSREDSELLRQKENELCRK